MDQEPQSSTKNKNDSQEQGKSTGNKSEVPVMRENHQNSNMNSATAREDSSDTSSEKATDMATEGFLSLLTSVGSRNKLVTQYDTTNNLSYRRAMVSPAGNEIQFSESVDSTAKKATPFALKFLDKIQESSPEQQDFLYTVSSKEAAISILDDATFNSKFEEDILKPFSGSSRQEGDLYGDDEIRATARMTGRMWRAIYRRIIVMCADPVNAYRLSRPLQLQIDYVSPLEAHLIGEVIEALDDVTMEVKGANKKLNKALQNALKNRNVGRTLVESSGSFNILWHEFFQISNIRKFTIASRISPVSFPTSSENFLSARGHALNSIFRQVLGPGRWFTRLVTGGREEFVVDDDNAIAQNLAAESNGFEVAMRNQYGNYFGRQKINAFRASNRLPTDESVVRTFTTSPASTLINNGVVHVLQCVAEYWESILSNPYGVFGNQRMEMLDVRGMLRFHVPVVLFTLANLRGLNSWDTEVLGPLIQELMNLGTGTDMTDVLDLISRVEGVMQSVCGGVSSRSKPFQRWLSHMMIGADKLMEEKVKIKKIVASVSVGIQAGYKLVKINKWETPSDDVMVKSILMHIKLDIAKKAFHKASDENERLFELGQMNLVDLEPIIAIVARKGDLHAKVNQLKSDLKRLFGLQEGYRQQPLADVIDTAQLGVKDKLHEIHKKLLEATLAYIEGDLNERQNNGLSDHLCRRALEFVTPRDKRTLIELVMKGLEDCRPAQLLLGRTKTLLRREVRRAKLDEQIECFSVDQTNGKIIPLAESIVRAQKAFMTIELDCTRMFAYNAFMEFDDLRGDLMKLQAISQIQCRSLDEARMNRLVAIRDCDPSRIEYGDLENGKQYFVEEQPQKYKLVTFNEGKRPEGKIYKVPPQNVLVVGGGPSGLLTTLHCLENCLKTGGSMRVYEARDAFEKAGGTYERAQVVRLDSRWVRMLRYHLGTSFEDVWVPAHGETDSHLGNNLPTQGFIEITIKDLESVLHLEISRLWSLNLIEVFSKSSAEYDFKENVMTKRGEALKENDLVKRQVDNNGNQNDEYHTWEVAELELHERLTHKDVVQGGFYYLYGREFSYGGLKKFQLVGTDIEDPSDPLFKFYNEDENITTLVLASRFPAVYPEAKHGFKTIVLQCIEKNRHGGYERQYIDFAKARKERFVMDVGQTNIVFATGKPSKSKNHFKITPEEPYGVCCIQGLKISLNMHNFGEKRWGDGVVDDVRSQTEQNTRVVGDFTKSLSVVPIVKEMIKILTRGHSRRDDYMDKFNEVKATCGEQIRESLVTVDASKWRRRRLQLRFFETGDNFYLGMEFTREYDLWKNTIVKNLVDNYKGRAIARVIDRLWYEAAFEVLRSGDVYNPSGSKFIPKLFLINSSKTIPLRKMTVGDSFRMRRNDSEKYEVLISGSKKLWVRSVEGILEEMDGDEEVLRESDLTRSPDGNVESKVAIATFPVGHVVCHKTLIVQESSYWCTFPIGDLQASPHFMRYSGLTGAAVNSMLINNYVGAALDSNKAISSKDRFRAFSKETNWSNEEVIRRGTGANYGEDGFLRPGFKYHNLIEFLYDKAVEMSVAGYEDETSPVEAMFRMPWLKKFAAALFPRGMELDSSYVGALEQCLSQAILKKLATEMNDDKKLIEEGSFLSSFQAYADTDERREFEGGSPGDLMSRVVSVWTSDINEIFKSNKTSKQIQDLVLSEYMDHAYTMAEILEKSHILARNDSMNGKRISSEAENEPKSTDSLVTDFAVEAQNFVNGLTISALLATISLALSSSEATMGAGATLFGVFLALFNIPVAFGTMTNVARYQNRNEEYRTEYYKEKLSGLEKALFKILSPEARGKIIVNPFLKQLQIQFDKFASSAKYYNAENETIEHMYSEMDANNIEHLQNFMSRIRSHFIPVTYQKEVYLKDNLWQVHLACNEVVSMLKSELSGRHHKTSCDPPIVSILSSMPNFSARLEESLQTGPILWGFIRKGKSIAQSAIVAPFRHLTFRMCNAVMPEQDGVVRGWRPIPTTIRDIRSKVNKVNQYLGSNNLKKETRDLKELFHATMESDLASSIYFVGCGSFTFAILLTAFNVFNATVKDGTKVPMPVMIAEDVVRVGASIVSIFASYYATEYLVRLLIHQRKVVKAIHALPSEINSSITNIKFIAGSQCFITFIRILAAVCTMLSLVLGLLHSNFESIGLPITQDQTVLGAFIAIGLWLLAKILGLYVEFFPLWNLEPTAGYDICIHFKSDLIRIYNEFNEAMDDVNYDYLAPSPKMKERLIREYTAREFLNETRFDSVLKADRFSAIMQTIQSEDFDLGSFHDYQSEDFVPDSFHGNVDEFSDHPK